MNVKPNNFKTETYRTRKKEVKAPAYPLENIEYQISKQYNKLLMLNILCQLISKVLLQEASMQNIRCQSISLTYDYLAIPKR